jgi:hypothetical protein
MALLLAALLLSGAGMAQTKDKGLVIEVTNAEGKPLRNACVTVVPKAGEIIFRKADKNGRVSLKGMQPGSYRVTAKADGYTAEKKQVAVGERELERVAFSLQPRRVGEN